MFYKFVTDVPRVEMALILKQSQKVVLCCRCCQLHHSPKLYDTSICGGQGLTKNVYSFDDDSRALYGFDMAVKQTARKTLKCDKYQPLFLSLWLCADGEGMAVGNTGCIYRVIHSELYFLK